ncbi:L-serine dehydratase, beta subunit [Pseudomonas sp. R4-34-07]|uniref:L-serine ammonia-lyase, iron-sulfur-dependent, subunit alpha n=1 Tax=Pseudomonas sp. R4-34-07 TaxID=658642 RepID=UPI000F581E93|nr:L-serine ammonia-lyase, iron-sulfur-dependent, subunit alpha [Pseudomonas sp. R4-34-07]AZF54719.1 L-serine dehydratase, beta subunit [Pseudomonas sp. R4-34-07]
MSLSVFDLFKIGIGPSSSHTVGPMRAAARFVEGLKRDNLLSATHSIKVELYGSLGATGKGHGSDKAVLLGLEGEHPDTVNTETVAARLAMIRKPLAYHPNGMIFRAFDAAGIQVRSREYYSVGGGFVVDEDAAGADRIVEDATPLTFPFKHAKDLLGHCATYGLSISQVMLTNENASISGAGVGCEGEVGVAFSMAAGALCEVLGGSVSQVENAAEIGMEHNLGLTCDPIGGLVQVPCIERNAMGSVKAINAVRMALRGDGQHFVSLDKVIRTMRQTGADMKSKYKETARGGLAVNIIEC